MDQETIENHIKNLGKRDFDSLAVLILVRFFKLTAIDVDGKGDGGSDYRIFNDEQGNKTAYQRTIQEAKWEAKAYADAKNAKESLHVKRYYFFTSRAHASTAFHALENRIFTELGINATCLGATELAGIVFEQRMLREFADAIGLNIDISVRDRPDQVEILLHAYVALGADRTDLQQEIYDDTLLLALHLVADGLDRTELVQRASELIVATSDIKERLNTRVDSLLTRGFIKKSAGAKYVLEESKRQELALADGIYQKELEQLAAAQAHLLHEVCGITWEAAQCATAATLLARWFIQRQLTTAERASVSVTRVGLSRTIGNPEQELKDLLRSAGVPDPKLATVLDELVRLASGTELIKKLTRAVTYVVTEGTDILRASRTLGASRWSEVTTTVDASVAIPFICASLFEPTQGRFSHGTTECMRLLDRAEARLVIPWVYINEISAHLLRAITYPEMPEFTESLEHSRNGFVAYYYQLKASKQSVPKDLRGFVSHFSRHALKPASPETVRSIMADIQPLLLSYGVAFDDIGAIPNHFRRDVELSYSFHLREMKRSKSQNLVEHDVQVLAHSRRAISERSDIRMCLTWDAAMIAVGRELGDCGWVVSPYEASDVVRTRLRVSDSQLSALAHSLARVRERPSEFGARIIDRVVQVASERMADWQFRERLKVFYSDALKRIDLSSSSYEDVDKEIDTFLSSEKINSAPPDVEADE